MILLEGVEFEGQKIYENQIKFNQINHLPKKVQDIYQSLYGLAKQNSEQIFLI